MDAYSPEQGSECCSAATLPHNGRAHTSPCPLRQSTLGYWDPGPLASLLGLWLPTCPAVLTAGKVLSSIRATKPTD